MWSDDQFARWYPEDMKNHVVNATEFKAKCLALLDEVDEKGSTITVTKRGRVVAALVPPKRKPRKSSMGAWKGKVEIVGDIINTSYLWRGTPYEYDRED